MWFLGWESKSGSKHWPARAATAGQDAMDMPAYFLLASLSGCSGVVRGRPVCTR